MEGIEYRSPKKSIEGGEEPQHHFDLMVDGPKIGGAEVDYYSKPIPLYQVTDLYVDFEHKGKGYASTLMDQVEEFLKARGRPGVLVDAIYDDDPAKGMYQRRGWVELAENPGLLVYNWPQDVDHSVMRGYSTRYDH